MCPIHWTLPFYFIYGSSLYPRFLFLTSTISFPQFFFFKKCITSLGCVGKYWLSLKSFSSLYLFYMLSLFLLFNSYNYLALISFHNITWSYVWIRLLHFSLLRLPSHVQLLFQITLHSCFISAAIFYTLSSITQVSCLLRIIGTEL